MWIANGIAGVLNAGASFCDTLESNLAGVPVIGDALAAPLGYLGDTLRDGKDLSYNLGDWGDGVISDVSENVSGVINLVGGVTNLENWKDVAQTGIGILQEHASNFVNNVTDVIEPVWTDLKTIAGDFKGEVVGALGTTWENLEWLYNNFTELIAETIEGAVMTFQYAGKFIQGSIVGFVSEIYINAKELFENFVDYVHAGVVNWTETQYEEVLAIALPALGKYFDTFEESLTELLGKGFDLLDRQWSILEDYFLWLAFKVLGVIAEQAETFSDKIWDMLEKILEKI